MAMDPRARPLLGARDARAVAGLRSTPSAGGNGNAARRLWAGWWFGTSILFSHIFGIFIPIDVHIFQRGSNHQPVGKRYEKIYLDQICILYLYDILTIDVEISILDKKR